jgi:hypothetical protein
MSSFLLLWTGRQLSFYWRCNVNEFLLCASSQNGPVTKKTRASFLGRGFLGRSSDILVLPSSMDMRFALLYRSFSCGLRKEESLVKFRTIMSFMP